MRLDGWIVMVLSVGSVLVLVAYCIAKVLSLPSAEVEESLVDELKIDTRDTQDAD